jgi:hypothetical protein
VPLTAEELAALPGGPIARFALEGEEPVAELLWAQPLERSAEAAGRFHVQLCWRALRTPTRNYTVLVHLVGPGDSVVSQRRSYPGLGDYPTKIWEPGVAFCDKVAVDIDEQLEKTLVYRVEVALLDETDERRLQAFTPEGQPLGIVLIGKALLQAANSPRQPVADNGQPLHLLDYELSGPWRAGTTEGITLRWGVAEPVQSDYQLFVHLRDLESGLPVAQADGPPLDGWYPTSWWAPGDVIADERPFPVPPDVPQGRYRLVVGFYDLPTGTPFGEPFDIGLVEVRR